MSDEIRVSLTADDEASGVITTAAENISGSLNKVETDAGSLSTAYDTLNTASTGVGSSWDTMATNIRKVDWSDLATSTNSLAVGSLSLYNNFLSLESGAIRVEAAHVKLEKATNSAATAQVAYNAAVEKYGVDSPEAELALARLQAAQDAVSVATERSNLAGQTYFSTIMGVAVSILPTVTGLITSYKAIMDALAISTPIVAAAQVTEDAALTAGVAPATGFAGAMATLSAIISANPFTIAILAIVGIGAALVTAYEACPAFRDAINTLAGILGGAFLTACNSVLAGFTALWNDVLVPLGKFLVGGFLACIGSVVTAFNTLNGVVSAVSGFLGGIGGAIVNGWNSLTGAVTNTNTEMQKLKDTSALVGPNLDDIRDASTNCTGALGDFKDETALVTPEEIALGAAMWDAQAKAATLKLKVDEMTTSHATLLTSLKAVVDAQNLQLLPSLQNVATGFNAAIGAGDYTRAATLVMAFAAQAGVSLGEAKTAIDAFNSKVQTIPNNINTQLVTTAQNNLQAFVTCSTGKFAKIGTDNNAAWDTVVSDTNTLIQNGLIVQAQANIAAFTKCVTTKHAQMVIDINADMTQLTTDYNTSLTALTTLAGTLTGNQKTAVLAQIDLLTTNYEAKMTALKTWLDTLYSSMVSSATTSSADIAAQLTTMVAGGADIFDLINALKTGNFTPTTPTAPTVDQGLRDQFASLTAALATAADTMAKMQTNLTNHPGVSAQAMYNAAVAAYATAYTTLRDFNIAHPAGTYGVGGIVTREQLAVLGEEGPEAVIPLKDMEKWMGHWDFGRGRPSGGVTISGPLVVVQGNADERTARLAADLVMNNVRRIIQS